MRMTWRALLGLILILVGCAAPAVARDVPEDPAAPTPNPTTAVLPADEDLVAFDLARIEGKNVVLYGFSRGDIDDAWYVYFYTDPPGGHTIEVHRRTPKDRPPSGICSRVFGILHATPNPTPTNQGTFQVSWLDAYDWESWAVSGHPDRCRPFPS